MKAIGIPALLILLSGCGREHAGSYLAASREARHLLQTPEALSESFWSGADTKGFGQDFMRQRSFAWAFWAEMLRVLPGSPRIPLMAWQTWYGREDLQRAFRHLYQRLGAQGRQERRAFPADAIAEALQWNDHTQYQGPDWDANRFEKWLAGFDTPEKARAAPGMEKILFNQEAMLFLLENYQKLETCQKRRQVHEDCTSLDWPERAVFIKTAWRRSEGGYRVDTFATDAASLERQWQITQWEADGSGEPNAQQSFALRLPAGQKFHLVGLHAALHIQRQWFWTSLWLGQTPQQDFAADQPDSWSGDWRYYRLCATHDFQKPLQQQSINPAWPDDLARIAQLLVQKSAWNWCSNPYLELGHNNQKTNCVGCHQHAGRNWSQQEFRRRLASDMPSMLEPMPPYGSADFVWSIFNGPEPLVQALMDDIEFFDVEDQF